MSKDKTRFYAAVTKPDRNGVLTGFVYMRTGLGSLMVAATHEKQGLIWAHAFPVGLLRVPMTSKRTRGLPNFGPKLCAIDHNDNAVLCYPDSPYLVFAPQDKRHRVIKFGRVLSPGPSHVATISLGEKRAKADTPAKETNELITVWVRKYAGRLEAKL